MKKKTIRTLVCMLFIATVLLPGVSSNKIANVSMIEINDRSQGTFEAEFGLRGNDEPLASLDGKYQSRGRFIVFSGTATNGELEGRFRGIFRGNLVIIQLPVRGRVLTIYGRVSFDEQQLTFTGNWKARGYRAGGWITGSLKL